MTIVEFDAALAAKADGRYYAFQLDVGRHSNGNTLVRWQAYIDGPGWGERVNDPLVAIESVGRTKSVALEELGKLPERQQPQDLEPKP